MTLKELSLAPLSKSKSKKRESSYNKKKKIQKRSVVDELSNWV